MILASRIQSRSLLVMTFQIVEVTLGNESSTGRTNHRLYRLRNGAFWSVDLDIYILQFQ